MNHNYADEVTRVALALEQSGAVDAATALRRELVSECSELERLMALRFQLQQAMISSAVTEMTVHLRVEALLIHLDRLLGKMPQA